MIGLKISKGIYLIYALPCIIKYLWFRDQLNMVGLGKYFLLLNHLNILRREIIYTCS